MDTERPGQQCPYCGEIRGVRSCGDMRKGYMCTRPRGHTGDHAACGIDAEEHPIASWPRREVVH